MPTSSPPNTNAAVDTGTERNGAACREINDGRDDRARQEVEPARASPGPQAV